MRKYFSLTKTLIKSGFALEDGKGHKIYRILLYLILLISLLPTLGGIYFLIDASLPLYTQIDQTASLMGSILFLVCSTTFIFSLFIIPSVFYFSNDIDLLLALPLKGEHIIAAKFTVCVIYEYMFAFALLIPATAAYIHICGFSLSLCLFALLTALLIPIFPLTISTALTILIMRFMPFFKSKDHFHFISGIILIVVGISLSITMNSMQAGEEGELLNLLMSGDNSLLTLFMKFFLVIPYFSYAIVQGSIIDFMIGVGICIISLLILLSIGKLWYFKGAIGNSEAGSKQKKITELSNKSMKQTNKVISNLKKEWRLLLRTPAFATNCIGSTVIFPFLLLFMTMFNQDQKMMFSMISSIQSDSSFVYYVIMFGLGIGLFIGSVNMVSATAISRDGSNYIVMKYLPISYRDQIHAKLLLGVILGIIGNLLTVIALMYTISFDWHYYIILFICMCISTVLSNELCIIVDMYKPKLVWEQEASAVKQNFSSFFATMIMLGLCAALIFVAIVIPNEYLIFTGLFLLILCTVASVLGYWLCGNLAHHAINKL